MLDILGNVAQCLALEGKALTSGITSYVRAIEPKVNDFLSGRLSLTITELSDLAEGLAICSSYFIDAFDTWQLEFGTQIEEIKTNNILSSIFLSLLALILHFIVFEVILLTQMT